MTRINPEKKAFRLVCFDLDGTIINSISSFWQFVCDDHRCDEEKKQKAHNDFFSNRITYDEWVEHDVRLWKDQGLTKDDFVRTINKLGLVPGAIETLKELKKRGFRLALISDSLDIALEVKIPDYKDLFDEVFINRIIFDGQGNISGWKPTKYGIEKKADGLKRMSEKESIPIEQCVFVGDGFNDIEAVKLAGLGISFNSSLEELDKIADVVIKKKNLREVLKHI